MTYAALFDRVCTRLTSSGCEDAAFDTTCILCDIGGLPRGTAPALSRDEVPSAACEAVLAAAAQRADGRPLQYILGSWEFLMLTLEVGEGVLIPRPDTELLCETAADYARQQGWRSCKVLDLCSGSGCVGLGTAALLTDCMAVTADLVELSPEAQVYLSRNIARYPALGCCAVQADVLQDAARFQQCTYDLLLSNPPYIPHDDLPGLQREVQHEPAMALDGGDGFVFYRAIAAQWLRCLRDGGLCAVEVGIGQAQTVAALWREAGLHDVRVLRDWSGIDRVVCGVR